MDPDIKIFLMGIALPAVVMFALSLALVRRAKSPGALAVTRADDVLSPMPAAGLAFWSGLGLMVGALVALVISKHGVSGPGRWPPVSVDDRVLVMIAVTGVLGMISAVVIKLREGRGGAWLGGAVGGAGVIVLLWPRMVGDSALPGFERAWTLATVMIGATVMAWSLLRVQSRVGPKTHAVLIVGVLVAIAVGLLGTGSKKLGELGMGVAAVAIGAAAVVLVMRRTQIPSALTVLLCGISAALLMTGRVFSTTPLWVVLGLMAVPLVAIVVDSVFARRLGDAKRSIAVIGISAIMALGVCAPGLKGLLAFLAPSSQGGGSDPYADYRP